ncbi:NERD domain-containing protein/DEAD/DEAH box helicase [Acinetobacter sp. ANC 5378]|uniref:nuclease-related domain-containing DEAD/DEAH box helicase n=1 Tax=Acinetobacter sp. ANC 5378 TaxID=2731249 RepID=UPI00148FDC7F|nr:NERD domain-containing protein/DEAD/DEAH box helicase [Acinetobacter sp. ANC 5378]NNG82709.1 ATP-binding domain-containing protein [Acinetobacter sp. ANC 5378]
MATLIPDYIDIFNNKSPGEELLFNIIKSDPNARDWIVFHSLNISKHITQEMGEIDFLIVIPNKGILVVEVKAHRQVKYIDGTWYLGKSDERRGPFKQAKDAMYSLRKYLREKNSYYDTTEFYSLVIFTHCNFDQSTIEWERHEFANRLDLDKSNISKIIENFIKVSDKNKIEAKSNKLNIQKDKILLKKIDKEYCKNIKNLLRPNFEIPLSNELIINNIKNELTRFTGEQIEAIDAIINNPRVIFNGSAGTGKTFIAIEVALRKAIEGEKVLFITFNKLINQYISKKLDGQKNISVFTIDKLFFNFFKKIRSDISKEEAENIILDFNFEDKYDFLIVDEAQDILRNELNLLFLEQILKGGFKDGCWNIFGDFKLQTIYSLGGEDSKFYSNLDNYAKKNNYVRYELTKNCRNPENTAREVLNLLVLDSPYRSYLRVNPSIASTSIDFYKNENEFYKKIDAIITSVKSKGFNDKDIVILTFNKLERSILNKENKAIDVRIFDWGVNSVRFTTLYQFKGLEAPIIIITDIDDMTSDYAIKKLFTGASRATDSVYFLMKDELKKDFYDLVKKKLEG